ncbi:MAG TPA: DUF1003 domain-containing protein [Ktedonobacteraceae bacterium]|nr:DUF1003 domain-containing protein [Ktedonobacteraceae bacterium]
MGRLYEHVKHKHTPRNVALLHKREQAEGTLNTRIAVGMTKLLSAMPTFWCVGLVIVGWIALQFTAYAWDKAPFPLLLTVLNLPQISIMIALGVGQGVLGRHQELQSQEMFETSQHSFHDIEEVMAHLDAQDQKILEILQRLEALPQKRVRQAIN